MRGGARRQRARRSRSTLSARSRAPTKQMGLYGPLRAAEGGDEEGGLARGVRREKLDHLVVVEGEAGGAEALGVGGEIEPPADEARLEVGRAIAPVAERAEKACEIREEEDGGARRPAERLTEAEEGGIGSHVARPDQLEGVRAGVVDVGARRDAVHRVDREVEVHQPRRHIRGEAAARVVERTRQGLGRDRLARELPRRPARLDGLGERAARGHQRGRQRRERLPRAAGRRSPSPPPARASRAPRPPTRGAS